jgi:hypothetical protein
MTGLVRWVVGRLRGHGLPPGFTGELGADEYVLAVAEIRDGGHLVATSHGLWVPGEALARRIGWHLVSKATWTGAVLVVTEAQERDTVDEAVLLADLPARRYELAAPGTLPRVVQAKVTASIRSRHHQELPDGGGAWFVQRRVPGRDGIVLQVRADPGSDPEHVGKLAAALAEKIRSVRGTGEELP